MNNFSFKYKYEDYCKKLNKVFKEENKTISIIVRNTFPHEIVAIVPSNPNVCNIIQLQYFPAYSIVGNIEDLYNLILKYNVFNKFFKELDMKILGNI